MSKYTRFDPDSDTRSLPEIAQAVHEDLTGGCEYAGAEADVLYLQERLKAWDNRPTPHARWDRYEAAVRELVAAVLAEADAKGKTST